MYSLGFIGAGNMAGAILSGVVSHGAYRRSDILIYDIDAEKCEKYRQLGFGVAQSENEVIRGSGIVFLAVRPTDLLSVLRKIRDDVTFRNVLVSIIAGVSISFIKKNLGKECKCIRVMPNSPILMGSGTAAIAYEMPITYQELQTVKGMFETVGTAEILPENRMNEVISLNSSSPVYIYMLVKAMIDGAVAQGIDSAVARRMAIDTLFGTAKMLRATDASMEELIAKVATPNGTTVKAVEILEKSGFDQVVCDAMLACTKRANGLEAELLEADAGF